MVPLFQFSPAILVTMLAVVCNTNGTVESLALQSSPQNPTLRKMPVGQCEDCELMFVGMPGQINAVDTTLGWSYEGQKLKVTGMVYHLNTKTPAKDVILYYYHTDLQGHYSPGPGINQEAKRHGHLRGWVKTGPDGLFTIYTCRPAQYPNRGAEAHIHVIVKEPDIDKPYWIDAWVFDDDPLLTPELRNRLSNHGGSGIMKTEMENGVQVAHQDVILGLNIPGYPARSMSHSIK
jgi:protocatechuate 3,4-dioxygenase, beta subunit